MSCVVLATLLILTRSPSEGQSPQVLLREGRNRVYDESQGNREPQGRLGGNFGSVVQMVENKAHRLISGAAPAAV